MPSVNIRGVKINTGYQYEDEDLTKLNSKSPIPRCEWTTPVLVENLEMAINQLPQRSGDRHLCELNLGGGHWIGAGIERKANGKLAVVYMDSLNPKAPMPEAMQRQFKSVLTNFKDPATRLSLVQESDIEFSTYKDCWGQGANVACGAYAHENLKRWAKNENPPKANPGEAELRRQHVDLINNDGGFTDKQQRNLISVRAVHMRRKDEFTESERRQLTAITGKIGEIGSGEVRQAILEGFANKISNPVEYFNNVSIIIQTVEGTAQDKAKTREVYDMIFRADGTSLVDQHVLEATAEAVKSASRISKKEVHVQGDEALARKLQQEEQDRALAEKLQREESSRRQIAQDKKLAEQLAHGKTERQPASRRDIVAPAAKPEPKRTRLSAQAAAKELMSAFMVELRAAHNINTTATSLTNILVKKLPADEQTRPYIQEVVTEQLNGKTELLNSLRALQKEEQTRGFAKICKDIVAKVQKFFGRETSQAKLLRNAEQEMAQLVEAHSKVAGQEIGLGVARAIRPKNPPSR